MSLVCAQCSRANPKEAVYCYYDGASLAGRTGGPVNAGAAPFPSQFVFPSGQACRNFDQLGLTCQQNWAAAVDLANAVDRDEEGRHTGGVLPIQERLEGRGIR